MKTRRRIVFLFTLWFIIMCAVSENTRQETFYSKISEHDGYIDIRSCEPEGAGYLCFDKTNFPLTGDYDISFRWKREYATGHHRCLFIHFLKTSDIPLYQHPSADNTYPAIYVSYANPDVLGIMRLRTGDGASYTEIVTDMEWGWHTLRIKRVDSTITMWHNSEEKWSGSFNEPDGIHENMQFGYHQATYRHIFLDDINYVVDSSSWSDDCDDGILDPDKYDWDTLPPLPIEEPEEPEPEEPEKKPPPAPSLCLTDITHSNSVYSGETFSITFNVTNKGNLVAKDVEVSIYFDENKLTCENSTLRLGDIHPGKRVTANFTLIAQETDQEISNKVWIEASANNMDENCGTSTTINIKPVEKPRMCLGTVLITIISIAGMIGIVLKRRLICGNSNLSSIMIERIYLN